MSDLDRSAQRDHTSPDVPKFSVTVGAGKDRPQGRLVSVADAPDVAALASALEQLPPGLVEAWWSAHRWSTNYRRGADWVSCGAVVQDLDFHDDDGDHVPVPADVRERVAAALERCPANLVHDTPRGWRLIAVPDRNLTDRETFKRISAEVASRIREWLSQSGLAAEVRPIPRDDKMVEKPCGGVHVDDAVVLDVARCFYSPRACVDGVARVGEVRILSTTLFDLDELASVAPDNPVSEKGNSGSGDRPFRAISKAARAYNDDHRHEWPKSGGTCPACGHKDCFGTLPENRQRWTCFAESHARDSSGCGRTGTNCWSGDALDLDAHAEETTRVQLLVRDGYLHPESTRRGTRDNIPSDPLHAWGLGTGTFRLFGWPNANRPFLVTLEYVREGIPRHRDKVDLNSAQARRRFARACLESVPDPMGSTEEILRNDLMELVGLVGEVAEGEAADSGAKGAGSVADLLVEFAGDATLFHDDSDRAFATIPVEKHRETWPIRSTRFKNWLRRQYYREHGKVPNSQALNDALGMIEGLAQIDGVRQDVHVRVAEYQGSVYLDLGQPDWRVVVIDSGGWRIQRESPVPFVRPAGFLALPEPLRGGSLAELRPFLNLRNRDEWVLFQAWLVTGFRPGRPFAILVINGEQGSAKSTAQRIARRLLDPNKAELRSDPKSEHDLVIACRNGWAVSFDNLSRLPHWLSDALCRVATGSGFGTRRLYSNDEEELFEGRRPILLNGIENIATNGDLLDRSVLLQPERIGDGDYRDEDEFWAGFDAAKPRILGALLDALSTGLRRLPDVRLGHVPRMADFAKLGEAAEPALDCEPGDFMRAYRKNRASVHEDALDASVLATEIRAFVSQRSVPFEGTATALLEALDESVEGSIQRRRGWPKTPSALSGKLRRLAPSLRGVGVEIDFFQEPGAKSRKVVRIGAANADAPRRSDAGASECVGGVGECGTDEDADSESDHAPDDRDAAP